MKINKFEDLKIWQESLKITKIIYDLASREKFSKDFSLRSQITRSIVSVSSNIVEGFEKSNNNEFIRYLKIAKGSAGETRNQLYIALTVGYLNRRQFNSLNEKLIGLSRQIGSFINYLNTKKKEGEFKLVNK